VLILGDFKSLFPEVLILVKLKTLGMKEMEKISRLSGQFLEVLILVKLKRHFSEVLILEELRPGKLRLIRMCSACIQKYSTKYTCMSM
jgi:hypothetical protein